MTGTSWLVGHGGWGDTRLGDFDQSDEVLNDHILIQELSGLPRPVLGERLRALGDGSAESVRNQLAKVPRSVQEIVVLTHFPPFRESCWHEGGVSGDAWLPFFACKAVGDVLLVESERRLDCRFTVLCGHTHSGGVAQIRENLAVHTEAADYGHPRFRRLDLT